MFLPLLASFAKGAAEGAEEMIDQEALNRYEVAAALKKAAADNPPGSIGPFTFKTNNKPGSYEYGQQQLNNLDAALGTAQGQAQFAQYIQQNDPSGNTINREIKDIIGIWSAKNQRTVKTKGQADAIIAPSFQKTYKNIYRHLNPNSTPLQDRQNNQPSGATRATLKSESQQRGYIVSWNGSTAWADGLNLLPEAPPAQLPSEELVEPNYRAGTAQLASTLAFKRGNGLLIGDVQMVPTVGIDAADNADVRQVVTPVMFGPKNNRRETSMAKVLNEKNTSLTAEKTAVANNLWFTVSGMEREDQAAEVGLVTSQFQLAHVPRNFKPASVTERQIAITPSGGSEGAIQYDASAPTLMPNTRDSYQAQIKDKNSPIAKQIDLRKYQADANLRILNMTGRMLDYLEEDTGGNLYDSVQKIAGGIKGMVIEIGNDLFGTDEDGIAAKKEYGAIKEQIFGLTKTSGDAAVYAALERLTAFAMAQIVQNKTDKISNKDVEEMKNVLGGGLQSKEMTMRVLSRFRSMALKSLLKVGGFSGAVGPRGALTYEQYYAANAQYQAFNRVSPSLSSARAAANYVKENTTNMTSGYSLAKSFRLGGYNQEDMEIYVDGKKRGVREDSALSNMETAIIYAYQSTVKNYRGSNDPDMPDFARNETSDMKKRAVISITQGGIDFGKDDNSRTRKLSKDIHVDSLVNHAAYIQEQTGVEIMDNRVIHVKDIGFMAAFVGRNKQLFFMQNEAGASIFATEDSLEKAFKATPSYEVKKPIRVGAAMGGTITDRLRGMTQNV